MRKLAERGATVAVALALAWVPLLTSGQERSALQTPPASTSARQMTDAAVTLLARLAEQQREAMMFELDEVTRTDWSQVPMFVHARPGLRFGDLSVEQRQAVHGLLRASLSSQGYQKVAGVMRLDNINRERTLEALERDGPPEGARPYYREQIESYGSDNYFVAIFGDPRSQTEWGWLIQGHHLAGSFTVSHGRTGFTPLFLGTIPHAVDWGPHAGWMALSHEVTRGFELMRALTLEQRSIVVTDNEVPANLLVGVGYKNDLPVYEGLKSADMTPAQRRLLRVLVEEYVRNSDFDAAEAQLEAIAEAGWDQLWLSWGGSAQDETAPFYYRVHGARILIACRQQDPNHIHTIVRDPANDYGESWLGQRYEEEHRAGYRFDEAERSYQGDGGSL